MPCLSCDCLNEMKQSDKAFDSNIFEMPVSIKHGKKPDNSKKPSNTNQNHNSQQ